MSYVQPSLRAKSASKSMLLKALNNTFLSKLTELIKKRTHSRLNKTLSVQVIIVTIAKCSKRWINSKKGVKRVDKSINSCYETGGKGDIKVFTIYVRQKAVNLRLIKYYRLIKFDLLNYKL